MSLRHMYNDTPLTPGARCQGSAERTRVPWDRGGHDGGRGIYFAMQWSEK